MQIQDYSACSLFSVCENRMLCVHCLAAYSNSWRNVCAWYFQESISPAVASDLVVDALVWLDYNNPDPSSGVFFFSTFQEIVSCIKIPPLVNEACCLGRKIDPLFEESCSNSSSLSRKSGKWQLVRVCFFYTDGRSWFVNTTRVGYYELSIKSKTVPALSSHVMLTSPLSYEPSPFLKGSNHIYFGCVLC